jgi:hypothetical protein
MNGMESDVAYDAAERCTVVPGEFFDALRADLDQADVPNDALARAAARLARFTREAG